jgi:hypothetical protein
VDGTDLKRCPVALINECQWLGPMLDAEYHLREYHVLPCAGGMNSQPATFVDALDALSRVRARVDAMKKKKSKT